MSRARDNMLARYLSESGITQEDFAKKVDLTQATVSKLCNGRTGASMATAFRIESATGGAVPAIYWHHLKSPSGASAEAGQ